MTDVCGAGIQGNRPLELPAGSRKVPVVVQLDQPQGTKSLGPRVIQRHRVLRRVAHLSERLAGRLLGEERAKVAGPRQQRPGGPEPRLDGDRLPEILDRLDQGPACQRVAAEHEGLVGVRVQAGRLGQPRARRRSEPGTDLLGHRGGDLGLQCQPILHPAVILARPQVRIALGFDELDGDAHAVALALHRSLDDGVHVKFAGDLGDGTDILAVACDRLEGDHAQGGQLPELGDHGLRHGIGQVGMLGGRGMVLQRQHGDGPDDRWRQVAVCVPRRQRQEQDRQAEAARQQPPGTPRVRRLRLRQPNLADQAISLSDHRLQVLRAVRVVAQGPADLADDGIDAVLCVEHRVGAPQVADDLLTADQLAVASGQQDQQLHRPALEMHGHAADAQLVAGDVNLDWI